MNRHISIKTILLTLATAPLAMHCALGMEDAAEDKKIVQKQLPEDSSPEAIKKKAFQDVEEGKIVALEQSLQQYPYLMNSHNMRGESLLDRAFARKCIHTVRLLLSFRRPR